MINANEINSSNNSGNGNNNSSTSPISDINPRISNRMNQNHPDNNNSSHCDGDLDRDVEGRLEDFEIKDIKRVLNTMNVAIKSSVEILSNLIF